MAEDPIETYDAALRAYFLATQGACGGDENCGAGAVEGPRGEVVAAAETAADRLRAAVLNDRRTWTVCRDGRERWVDGE